MESADATAFTDEELAFLRHARFGDLPARVLPSEYVELVETDPPRDEPDGFQENLATRSPTL